MTMHGMVAVLVMLVSALTLVSGCGTTSTPVAMPPAGVPLAADPVRAQSQDYNIRPGDTLDVKFYYHPDHNQDGVLVAPDGKIELPLVGEVKAAERTPAQLSRELKARYAQNLRDPEVNVRVRTENTTNPQRVYVGGEVTKPGYVAFRPGMTVAQAVIEAGGARDTAQLDSIVLLRKVGEPNEYQPSKIDLAKVLEEGDTKSNVALQPQDILVLPKTAIAKLNVYVEQYIIRMIPIRISISPI